MFTRAQRDLLREVADLVDKGVLHTTPTERIDRINAENLRRGHATVERGTAIGKTVLAGF